MVLRFSIIAVFFLLCACQASSSRDALSQPPAEQATMNEEEQGHEKDMDYKIDEKHAITLARQAVEGKISIPADAAVTAIEQEGRWTVTFKMELEPGVRGPDYHARVVLDAHSGEILEILGPS